MEEVGTPPNGVTVGPEVQTSGEGVHPTPPRKVSKAKGAPRFGITRRKVLGAAGVAAVGVAAARLTGIRQIGPLPLTTGGTPQATPAVAVITQDWISPLSKESAQISHLLRRTTFGSTAEEYQTALKLGFKASVDRLLESSAPPKPFPGGDEANKVKPINIQGLQTWWVDQMLTSSTPFTERMTLFWHGHFTSDYRKVTTQSPFIYWQNLTWRKHALGTLPNFIYAVTVDPAMLRYLDLGQSTGKAPNENYSRELMELFTLGDGQFIEDDVRNLAKALSGWREPRTEAMRAGELQYRMDKEGKTPTLPPADTSQVGVFETKRAYAGPPFPFLEQSDAWDTKKALSKIMEQESVAPFIVTKLVLQFVTSNPEPGYIKRLADSFRASHYDVKTLMRDIFMSPEFLAPNAYRSLVKSPVEFMLSSIKALALPSYAKTAAQAGGTMGQALFDMPDVGGWPNNESWVSSANTLARINFASEAVSSAKSLPTLNAVVDTQLEGVVGPQTAKLFNETTDDKTRWFILLGSPEWQLK